MTNQAPQAPENQAAAQNQGVDVSYHEPNGTAKEMKAELIYGLNDIPPLKDALFAASKVLIYLHQKLDELDKDLVYTTGEIVCHPNVHTVIPDYVEFSLDARHQDDCVIDQVKEIINSLPKMFEKCEVSTSLAWHRDTVYFNKTLINYVLEATKKLNYPYQYINSGAGHDAQMISYMLPTTMIFVPSKNGHSHCDEEFTSIKQCYQGANVLLNAVLKCDEDFE